jgi:peptidyl-prolyl cis-trans isomerase C
MKNLVIALLATTAIVQGYFLATSNKADFSGVKREYTGDVVAKVNGDEIKEGEIIERLNFVTRGKAENINLKTLDSNAIEALAKEAYVQRLVLKKATDLGVQKDADTIQKAAEIVHALYKEKSLEKIAGQSATEEKIKAKYDALIKETQGKKQFKVRHILLKDEAQAKAAREKINASNFEQAAKEISVDKGSAARGGDLGFIFPEEFIPEFGAAVKSLKKGEISQPIKTEFGYHIIQVQDSKEAEILPFEKAKDGVKRQVSSDAVKEFINDLAKDLKVEVLIKKDGAATPAAAKAADESKKAEDEAKPAEAKADAPAPANPEETLKTGESVSSSETAPTAAPAEDKKQ